MNFLAVRLKGGPPWLFEVKAEVEMPFGASDGAIMQGILRLRMPIRFAHRHALLRMIDLWFHDE
jgi:hypothetical protein